MKLNGVEIDTVHESCQYVDSRNSRIKLNTNRPRNRMTFNGKRKNKNLKIPPKIPMRDVQVHSTIQMIFRLIAYILMGLIILGLLIPVLFEIL